MEEKKWYQVLKQSAEGFYKKWEEIAGPGSVVSLNEQELSRLAAPTAERLANEILGAGTFKIIQDRQQTFENVFTYTTIVLLELWA